MLYCLLIAGLVAGVGAGEEPAPLSPQVDREAWSPSIRQVFEQLDTLDLFSTATKLGRITVKVPRELQKLPMRMIDEADELRNAGVDLYVTELQFQDINFIYDRTPEWNEDRPLIPTMIEFKRLGVSADAKTRLATIPVGATFQNGRMPVEFLPMLEKGFDVLLLPESRAEETVLDDVTLKVGGPIATGIANRFFSKKVAQLILEHGVGQTLQMGQGDLITGDMATRLLNIKGDSTRGRAVESLVDILR